MPTIMFGELTFLTISTVLIWHVKALTKDDVRFFLYQYFPEKVLRPSGEMPAPRSVLLLRKTGFQAILDFLTL